LHINEDTQELTQGLLSARLLPMGSVDDALHIAVASVHGMEYLLTWNFKHINNAG
jgi:predicted nucleic acid-binding protein